MTIQQLSQEIGIGTDTLRIWERRYGYPVPQRDSRGHRRYSRDQLEELRVVKRLQSLGYRPGRIFALPSDMRRKLLEKEWQQARPESSSLERLATKLTPHEIDQELRRRLQDMGLENFIRQFAIPLIQTLDRGWTAGCVTMAREHLVSDRLDLLLNEQLNKSLAGKGGARMLFLTLSGKRHKLGLLMSAALFHQQGIEIILLHEELPLSEIPQLAADLQVAGVALSFSAHYSVTQAKKNLVSLRKALDRKVKLFAGGYAVQSGINLPDIIVCTELDKIPALCRQHLS